MCRPARPAPPAGRSEWASAPEARQLFALRLEQAARGGAGLMLGEEVGDSLRERAVIFGDGDRHE
jgi:hypothetical protein